MENMYYRSHPWHGLALGDDSPGLVNCYIEMVPTDTIKYELDKDTGILKVDRPQKFSSLCPTLYGLLPRTYAGEKTAKYCMDKTGRKDLVGDGDPLDICVFTEKAIVRGDLIVQAMPVGGFRLLDGNEVDDKIIGVMRGDRIYGQIQDISDFPEGVIERLRHYFLTYKDNPERTKSNVEIIDIYGRDEAYRVIEQGCSDYQKMIAASKGFRGLLQWPF
ncbi:MAG: inorganic pyrophosphatase [Chlamydiota bacterium]|nr:inorganic pyrophosphatase [Chlamydiota bacterium]